MTGALKTITAQERRVRLARRHRLAQGLHADDVVEAASSMVCLHGTDPATVYLSARARVPAMKVPDLDRALYSDRSLAKHLAMRRTLFVFPRGTLSAAQAGASNRVATWERRSLIKDVEQGGLHSDGARWLARAEKAILDALSEGRDVTTSELRAEIPKRGHPHHPGGAGGPSRGVAREAAGAPPIPVSTLERIRLTRPTVRRRVQLSGSLLNNTSHSSTDSMISRPICAYGSRARRSRRSCSEPDLMMRRARCRVPSSIGPPRTTKPSSASAFMNTACPAQSSCSRIARASFHAGP